MERLMVLGKCAKEGAKAGGWKAGENIVSEVHVGQKDYENLLLGIKMKGKQHVRTKHWIQ